MSPGRGIARFTLAALVVYGTASAQKSEEAPAVADCELRVVNLNFGRKVQAENSRMRYELDGHKSFYYVGARKCRSLEEVEEAFRKVKVKAKDRRLRVVLSAGPGCAVRDLVRVVETLNRAGQTDVVLHTTDLPPIALRLAAMLETDPERITLARSKAFVRRKRMPGRDGSHWCGAGSKSILRVVDIRQDGVFAADGAPLDARGLKELLAGREAAESRDLAFRPDRWTELHHVIHALRQPGKGARLRCLYLGVTAASDTDVTAVADMPQTSPVALGKGVGKGLRPHVARLGAGTVIPVAVARLLGSRPALDDNAADLFGEQLVRELTEWESTLDRRATSGARAEPEIRRASALALALLARGNTLRRGEHRAKLRRIIMWLRNAAPPIEPRFDETEALRCLALLEAQSLSSYRLLGRDAQASVDALLARRKGKGSWSDARASALALEALRLAQAAGFEVPEGWRDQARAALRAGLAQDAPASRAWATSCLDESARPTLTRETRVGMRTLFRSGADVPSWPLCVLAAQALGGAPERDQARARTAMRKRATERWESMSPLDRAVALLALHAHLRYAPARAAQK